MDLDNIFEKLPYDRLTPLPKWQRLLGIGVVLLLLFGIFYFFVVSGKNEQISKLENDLDKIKREVEVYKQHGKKFAALESEILRLENQLLQTSEQLPSQREIPKLLEQVSNTGRQSGLEFVKFKPLGENPKDHYSEVPVALKVTGRFHDVLRFFDEVSRFRRIVTVDNIKMGDMKKGKNDVGQGNLSVECMATTYRFLEKDLEEAKNKSEKNGDKKKL